MKYFLMTVPNPLLLYFKARDFMELLPIVYLADRHLEFLWKTCLDLSLLRQSAPSFCPSLPWWHIGILMKVHS